MLIASAKYGRRISVLALVPQGVARVVLVHGRWLREEHWSSLAPLVPPPPPPDPAAKTVAVMKRETRIAMYRLMRVTSL